MKAYWVIYKMDGEWELGKGIMVPAKSKEDAYDKAVNELIPAKEGGHYPYGAYVDNVTYNNGKVHYFNTSMGNCY